MREYPTVTDLIGHTPIVRFPHVQPAGGATLLAKLEYMNPGGSIKDRIAGPMIDAAERDGLLKPGGTIVEPTSRQHRRRPRDGRRAARLPVRLRDARQDVAGEDRAAARVRRRGGRLPDERRARGSRAPTTPVSNRLAEEIPGRLEARPVLEPEQPAPRTTSRPGPRSTSSWARSSTCWSPASAPAAPSPASAATCASGCRSCEVVGADPEGSIYNSPDIVRPYLIEGVGEDFWPTTFDPPVVDRWITVSDRDAFLAARRLAREEGVLVGGSAGMALHAAIEVCRETDPAKNVLVILPDGGRPYLSKVFDDAWMIEHGFLERVGEAPTVAQVLRAKATGEDVPAFVAVGSDQRVSRGDRRCCSSTASRSCRWSGAQNGDNGRLDLGDLVGAVHERDLLDHVFRDHDALERRGVDADGAAAVGRAQRRRRRRRLRRPAGAARPWSSPTASCRSAC